MWTSKRHEIPSQFQQHVCFWSLAFPKKNQKHPCDSSHDLSWSPIINGGPIDSLWPTLSTATQHPIRQQRIKLETHPCNPTTYWWYFEGWFGSTWWPVSWGPRRLAYKQRLETRTWSSQPGETNRSLKSIHWFWELKLKFSSRKGLWIHILLNTISPHFSLRKKPKSPKSRRFWSLQVPVQEEDPGGGKKNLPFPDTNVVGELPIHRFLSSVVTQRFSSVLFQRFFSCQLITLWCDQNVDWYIHSMCMIVTSKSRGEILLLEVVWNSNINIMGPGHWIQCWKIPSPRCSWRRPAVSP